MKQYTPMIQQYLTVKAEYPDAFLFYRLGDFYEMFFEDAIKASRELEITLTSRQGGVDEPIPMCGVPHHSAQGYIETLVERGYRVAICEQVEDPKETKGIVRREVTQLITPGTVMEGKNLSEKENNYIATVSQFATSEFGLAYIDLSTGEFKVSRFSDGFQGVLNELLMLGAKEIVVASDFSTESLQLMKEQAVLAISTEDEYALDTDLLLHLEEETLRKTAARLLNYLQRTQKRSLEHLQHAECYQIEKFLTMDYYSKRNLELTETLRSNSRKGSLLWLLDETKTAMGGRRLKQWIERPLLDRKEIEKRHDLVEAFMNHFFERENIRELLDEVYDLERLAGRVAYGNCNARDLVQLKKSLQQVPAIRSQLHEVAPALAKKMDPCEKMTALLEAAFIDNPPLSIKDGEMIREGYSADLDQYRYAAKNGKQWIAELEQKEREKTGIKSLKIRYNRIFGYYIEITKANIAGLDDSRYERKQTMANAERFITPELKEMEVTILQAEEESVTLEYRLFVEIREQVKEMIPRLQRLARLISGVDCLQCFAKISEDRRFVRAKLSKQRRLSIQNGRHPVVEKVLKAQEYVPNDCEMNPEREILLLTGPNMSGKSTFMRQIAHIVLLNQIGCFVPAEQAELPIYDKIFTRIGAADDLVSGQSTFMVEMMEARNAIAHATKNSLLLFDEMGRGTSTYDGMALAQAIIEYVHNQIHAQTVFSTHYHELTRLDKQLSKLSNIHVRAIEQSGKVIFLHKVVEGAADKSYGIHVAELAEMPNVLVRRAAEILKELEVKAQLANKYTDGEQMTLFDDLPSSPQEQEIMDELQTLAVMELSPMDALGKLYEWQKKLNTKATV